MKTAEVALNAFIIKNDHIGNIAVNTGSTGDQGKMIPEVKFFKRCNVKHVNPPCSYSSYKIAHIWINYKNILDFLGEIHSIWQKPLV